MILTVTPNPSVDLLFETERLVWDDANRMSDPRRRPGGQGINVTRAVRALGGGAVAIALLGGRTGAELAEVLNAEGTPLRVVQADGDTRTFVAMRESQTGRSMLLNARGPARTAHDAAALLHEIERALTELQPTWLACCGSLPAGFPADFYARAAQLARTHHVRVVVDCDGAALRAAAPLCQLLVPNQHEAERLTGASSAGSAHAAVAARQLLTDTTCEVAITLGADGAVLAARGDVWHARAPHMMSGSAVGAGDAFLAGLLLAQQLPPDQRLRRAVAAGSAALLSHGAALVDATTVSELLPMIEVVRAA